MKKYLSFFRLRFLHGLQYRTAAVSGIVTQFVWGAMEILLFRAFYQADPTSFPMTFQALSTYVWLQQAFLALYMAWFWEMELFDSITTGNVVYELCRPVRLYNMWYVIAALLLPKPYGLTLPSHPGTWFFTVLSMVLALFIVTALNMVVYMSVFYTISSQGIRLIVSSLFDFFSGAVIPLPFLPGNIGAVVSLLPFASIQNVPFRIFGGDLSGREMYLSLSLQVFWLLVMLAAGRTMERRALKHVVIQGG